MLKLNKNNERFRFFIFCNKTYFTFAISIKINAMNCLRFFGKKRPHEQPPSRNLQQQVEEVSAIQANVVVESVGVQRLVKAQQTTIIELEKNQQNLQKLVAALSVRVGRFEAAKFVERKIIGQMELELKETTKKLEELGINSNDAMEKPRRGVTKLKTDMAQLVEEQNRKFEQQLDELGNNAKNALDKALQAKTVIELKEYQTLMNAYDALQEKVGRMKAYQKEQQQNIYTLTRGQKNPKIYPF